MQRRRALPVALALLGLLAVLIGVRQGLVHVAPGYEGTITTGWDGPLNHEERLLSRLAVIGVVGSAAALRWRRLAAVTAATGGVVIFYALRAVLHYVLEPGLYVEVQTDGGPTQFVLGAEPVLLTVGGAFLVAAAVVEWCALDDDAAAPGPASTV